MICFHPQTWPFAFPYVKILYRTFCNYAFYSPPIHIYITFMHLADAFIQSDLQCIQDIHFFISVWFKQTKSCKTQLRLRNVKRFAPLQTQTDTQMLEHTHTHTLSSYMLTHSGTYILFFCLVSGPSAVRCHSPHFMLLSQDIFPQISHAHVPSDSSHTCQKHTAHAFNIKSKLTLWLFTTRFWSYCEWFIGEHYSKYFFCLHNLALPLSLTSPIVN